MDIDKILLQDIIPLEKWTQFGNVLLVRHQRDYLNELIDRNLLERYQSFQNKKAFRECKIFVSFVAEPNNHAKLFGIYRNLGIEEKENLPQYEDEFLVSKCNPHNKKTDFFMHLEPLNEFRKYKNRLIINWGLRLWYATYGEIKEKEVIKILPKDFVEKFPGIMKISIAANILKEIINNRQTEWYEALTRLQAVYLILDKSTGLQYIGTTYGEKGLWQRWESYVKNEFTAKNIKLLQLKDMDKNFFHNLQFSILEILPKNACQEDCTNAESIWKIKLGTRNFGLNDN